MQDPIKLLVPKSLVLAALTLASIAFAADGAKASSAIAIGDAL